MAYLKIGDVLDRIQRFHFALSRSFETVRDDAAENRQREILAVLRDEERVLAANLTRIRMIADDRVTKTWLQFEPDRELWQDAEAELTEVHDNPERALQLAIEIDRALLFVYERIASSQVPPRVRELFAEFAQMQRARRRRHALESLDTDI